MPLPDNITTIQVKGKYLDIFGNPIIGKVSFSIQPVLVDAGAEVVIIPRTVEAPLNDDGSFTAVLPATDDPDVSPTDFTIQVVEQFEGGGGGSFSITLPADTPQPVDITKFSRGGTPPSGGTITYATQAALNAEVSARTAGDAALLAKLPDYVNVKGAPYSAAGDDTTDDIDAIEAAIAACPEGGIVYFPVGRYAVSRPVRVPPHVTLQGTHANGEQLPTDTAPRASIRPLPGFVGDAVIKIDDKTEAGYADESREQRIYDLSIDGERIPAGTLVDGIKIFGYVQSINMRDVCIWKVTGNGVTTVVNAAVTSGSQAPLAMKWERVLAYEVGETGFILINSTDSTFTDVIALGCNADGWFIDGAANSTFQNCRAEWSSGEGFKVTPRHGPVTFDGCSTDRSDFNGMSIVGGDFDSSVLITSARLNRDGRNGGAGGGDYSGLRVDSNCPVLVDGLMVNARKDDNTTGPLSPDYGVSVIDSQELILHSAYLNAKLGGLNDLGGNSTVLRGMNVEEKIGDFIGASIIRKRGLRAEQAKLSFFSTTGAETNLLDHPTPLAVHYGMEAWSLDWGGIIGEQQLDAGVLYLNKVRLVREATISKVCAGIGVAGAGLTAGQNWAGIVDVATGNLLRKTADQTTAWATTGPKEMALASAVALQPGEYWVALLANGTTRPSFCFGGAGNADAINYGSPATAKRFGSYGAALTDIPANVPPGSVASNWMGLAVGIKV